MFPQIFQVWHILTYFLLNFFILVNLFYVHGYFGYIYICALCVLGVLMEEKGTDVTDSCEQPCGG